MQGRRRCFIPTLRRRSQRTIGDDDETKKLLGSYIGLRSSPPTANTWRDEEKRLLHQIDAAAEKIARLRAAAEESRASVEDLVREVGEMRLNVVSKEGNREA